VIKNLNHVGMSVANLERSLRFYRDLLGMEVVAREAFSGALYETILALRDASGEVALVKLGNLELELFEFSSPAPLSGDLARPVCNHGITHFCIEVSDIDNEYQRLKAAGVTFHCPPLEFPGYAKATYGRDPDGNVIEFLQVDTAAKPS
jgi:glyoxylase I family protein